MQPSGAKVENLQPPLNNEGNGQVGHNYEQVPLMASPAVPLNADMIMASAAGGMFSLQAANQFVTLTAEQQS